VKNLIACRIFSYGNYQERGWSHLREIGCTNVEVPVFEPAELPKIRAKLAENGLTATSVIAKTDVAQDNAVEVMKPQLDACASLGSTFCFLSVKAGDADRAKVWERLRGIGDEAAARGITVVLETHPDLLMNGDLARETMQAVNHPNVRVNFDTANIYFYNQGTTAVAELQKVIEYVGAVHLKDTPGGYQEWTFPALGTGVVDFPEIFRLLNARGFYGPFTMELEGTKGLERTEAEQLAYVAESVAYLRRIGVMQD
jgi:sugar phosphate isomerase/epimerase